MRGLFVFVLGILLVQNMVFPQGLLFKETFDNWENNPPCPAGWECSTTSDCLPTAFCFWNRQDEFSVIGSPDTLDCDGSGNYARCNTTQLQFGQVLTMTSPIIDLSVTPLVDSLVLDYCYINGSVIPIDEDGIRISFSADSGQTWIQQFGSNSRDFPTWESLTLPIRKGFYTPGFRVRFEGFSGNSTGDVGIDGLLIANISDNCGIQSASFSVMGNTTICKDQIPDTLLFQEVVQMEEGVETLYAITNEGDTIIELVNASFFDLNTLPAGQYTLQALSFVGILTARVGQNIDSISSSRCLERSTNSIDIEVSTLTLNSQISSPFGNGVSCQGANDAAIELQIEEGEAPYTIIWNTGSTQPGISSLRAGTYDVEVRDQNQCVVRDTIIVEEPEPLDAEIDILSNFKGNAISCTGAEDGALTTLAEGGTPPYNYLWSNGSTNDSIDQLPARQYIVFVSDANGCVALDSAFLDEPSPLQIQTEVISDYDGEDISSPDARDGQVQAAASGGTSPYEFKWNTDPPQNSQVAVGLGAGIYSVTVTDGNLCQDSAEVIVRSPGDLGAFLRLLSPVSGGTGGISCFDSNDGILYVEIVGGIPPYEIEWNNFPEAADQDTLFNLSAGIYQVSVQDAEGTIARASLTLEAPPEIEIILEGTPPACIGQSGQVRALVSGGTPGYEFLWNDGVQDSIRTDVDEGLYTIVVTDQNGCTSIDSLNLTSGDALVLNFSVQNEACPENGNGKISLSIENGITPFQYLWSNGAMTSEIENLSAGLYTVEVIDSLGCSQSDTVRVGINDSLVVEISTEADGGGGQGSASANVSGGNPPYSYTWGPTLTDTTQTLMGLSSGTYTLIVQDSAGCEVEESFEIPRDATLCPPIHIGFSPNGDGINDTWFIPCLEEFENNSITIFDRWGQTLIEFANYDNSWNGSIDGKEIPPGSYFFLIRSRSNLQVFKGTLTIIR